MFQPMNYFLNHLNATPIMKQVTFSNAIQCAIATVFAIAAIITGIATSTGHNVFFGLMAAVFAWVLFTDDQYGESVKQYILRKRGK